MKTSFAKTFEYIQNGQTDLIRDYVFDNKPIEKKVFIKKANDVEREIMPNEIFVVK